MINLPNCPQCQSEYTYEDGTLFICPECSHEWAAASETKTSENQQLIKVSNGNVLIDGDTVTVMIKEETFHFLLNNNKAPKLLWRFVHFSIYNNVIYNH